MTRALIVDDNAENLYYLTVLLTGNGFVVDAAHQGAEALDLARSTPPDIVVSDLLMPVMDGYTLLRHWKADPALKHIPFVVYTATYVSAEDERLALDLGADAFIVKPAEPDDFMARIRAVEASTARAAPAVPREPEGGPDTLIQNYNQVLVRKLEQKIIEQEATHRALEHEIAVREDIAETQRAILDALPAMVVLLDADGTIRAVNAAWRRGAASNGLTDAQAGNYLTACETVTGPAAGDARAAAQGIRRVMAGDTPEFVMEYPCPAPGEPRWFRLVAAPMRRAGAGGAVIMQTDVTERRLREAKLRQQSALLDNAKDAITVRDLDHRIEYWNRAAETLYGWRSDEVIGRAMDDTLHARNPARLLKAKEEVLRTGAWSGRFIETTKDGKPVTVEANWTLMRDEHGAPLSIFAIDTDIAERLSLESRLVQSQKLEAVGSLAGGMAHDFNNILSIIMGNLDLLRKPGRPPEMVAELLQEALEACLRGAELNRGLLAYARHGTLEESYLDLNAVIAQIVKLLGRMLGENIVISFEPAADLWPVFVDKSQVQAAITNLATNARDAMPAGGTLTIRTRNLHLDEVSALQDPDLGPGDYAVIEITDTGIGMTQEVKSRIFEPFFTTKEPGRGTGLGLSMVFGFFKQSGGHVTVYSEVGLGTVFRLYLPRADVEAPDRADPIRLPPAGGNGETVLVVEDRADLRRVVIRQLRELGYRVLEAENAVAALAMLAAEPVDLLFSDIVMPGPLNGIDLARRTVETWPAVKIVLTSGYSEVKFTASRFGGKVRLLAKPYSGDQLAAALREALSGRKGERSEGP